MSHRLAHRGSLAALLGLALLTPTATALAHDRDHDRHDWRDHHRREDGAYGRYDHAPGREAWLADCRSRMGKRDRGVGGALIGGAIGGVAGNRIAGRGNRTVGTVAGAAVGAAAGVAIDRAEDRGLDRDTCETYLDDYYARYDAEAYGYDPRYAQPGYAPSYAPAYSYANGCCGAPVMMVPAPVQAQPECTETVEYVYEDVPVRTKTYRPRRKAVPDKRVKVAPDKRISLK